MARRSSRSRQRAGARRGDARAVGPAPVAAPIAAPTRRADDDRPAFWFHFDVTWAKLALGRALLFGILAVDAVLQIRHAPRYGAGGLHVAQLPGLDALGPTRDSYGVGQLVEAYLFVLAGFGIATRTVVPVAAGIYAWLYFTSQLDSYQHHYLVALLLVIACFIPWTRPASARPDTRVRTWALRLLLVQIAIVYLWAAISKLDGAWLDGKALSLQLGGSTLDSVIAHTVGWPLAAKLVVGVELVLAATVWLRPAWIVAAPLGLALHIGIAFSGLEIGRFAWLMIGLYAFVVPDRIWVALANLRPVRALAAVIPRGGGWPCFLAIIAAASLLAMLCDLDHAPLVGIALAIVALAIARARRGANLAPVACAHLAAIVLWNVVDRVGTVSADYYNLWGGSALRLGDLEGAEHAYRALAALDRDDGNAHFKLGRVLLEEDRGDAGLVELRAAQRLEPRAARAWLREAQWFADHARPAEALAAARAGLAAEPKSAAAKELVDALAAGTKPLPRSDD